MRCKSILAISLVLSLYGQGLAQARSAGKPIPAPTAKVASDVKAKDLGGHTKKGIAYLVSTQNEDGGWGEGEEAPGMGGAKGAKPSNVADTSIAVLALIRSGSTPSSGEHAKRVAKGLDFIAASIEKSDDKSLFVTDVRGTRVQSKIGVYVDTFLSSLVLAEAKGRMPDAVSEKRIGNALDKVIGKIESNQKADGTFEGNAGWASVLSTGIAGKSLNRARAAGAAVSDDSLRRAEGQAVASFDRSSGGFKSAGAGGLGASAPSDAGVPIYNTSAQLSSLQDANATNVVKEKEYKEVLADAKAPKAAKDQAKKELGRIEATREIKNEAVKSVVKSLENDQFISGFGSNGGEEFLSYMNISETLVAEGGSEWKKWDREIGDNLARVQNADGSWSGNHCITGRTFVTAAALLVLTTDRIGMNAQVKGSGASLETGKEPVKESVASKSWYEKIWNE